MSEKRIVAIINPGHMFDADQTLGYLSVPPEMDLRKEQENWTHVHQSFFDYLLSLDGVERAFVEEYVIYHSY